MKTIDKQMEDTAKKFIDDFLKWKNDPIKEHKDEDYECKLREMVKALME